MKLQVMAVAVLVSVMLGGCANLGQEEFACKIVANKAVCAAPHDMLAISNHKQGLVDVTISSGGTSNLKGKQL